MDVVVGKVRVVVAAVSMVASVDDAMVGGLGLWFLRRDWREWGRGVIYVR